MTIDFNFRVGRRQKIVYASYNFVSEVLSGGFFVTVGQSEWIQFPLPIGIPETARVVSVYAEPIRNAFCLVLEDESFELVDDGQVLPELTVRWESRQITLEKVMQERVLAWLGQWRDKMPTKAVTALQDLLDVP